MDELVEAVSKLLKNEVEPNTLAHNVGIQRDQLIILLL